MTPHIHDAVIVGAGFGGLGMAAQLERNGIHDFVVLEQADRLGGVWRDNTYPGAACDTQSLIYCFSFFLHTGVSSMFAGQSELLAYLESLAAEFGLEDRIELETLVTSATWLEDQSVWEIRTESGKVLQARLFIPAWGQLGVPFIPSFEGIDTFQGSAFHSARWNHDVDLTDARVASVGAAASAVQYVPEVGRVAGRLTVFQRSANYILPRNQVIFSDDQRARFHRDPAEYVEMRDEIHRLREAGFARTRHNTSAQQEGAADARAHLESQVSDPELRRLLTPDYEFGCKRILRSDDFYPALTRDNVELVTDPIERFTAEGIITRDGTLREFDIIIFGTGFRSQAFQAGLRITGRGGVTLDERWGSSPEAHLGMTVDGFPNMFIVYGPNTNLNHNSVVTMLEAQQDYILQAIDRVRDEGFVLDVRPDVLRASNDRVQLELEQSAFSGDCSSWYKNSDGKVINNWSGSVEEYRAVTSELRLSDFVAV